MTQPARAAVDAPLTVEEATIEGIISHDRGTLNRLSRLATSGRNADGTSLTLEEQKELLRQVVALSDHLFYFDDNSGDALYLSGEAWRYLGTLEKTIFTQENLEHITSAQFVLLFREYLNNARTNTVLQGTDAHLCYQDKEGYCDQRTGWVAHLIANYYYVASEAVRNSSTRRKLLQDAQWYAKLAMEKYPNGGQGFTQRAPGNLGLPTPALIREIDYELGNIKDVQQGH